MVDDFASKLQSNVNLGDSIHTTEPNRYHTINQYFVYQGGGKWLYVRRNMDNGDVYENRMVDTRRVASDVLSTALVSDGLRWKYN